MAKAFGVETEFDVAPARGGGGGAGNVRPPVTSNIGGSLQGLSKDIASLATQFADVAKDRDLGNQVSNIVEGAALKGNPAQAEIFIRNRLRRLGRTHGFKAMQAAKGMIDNPIRSFTSGSTTTLVNVVDGSQTTQQNAPDTGPTNIDEVKIDDVSRPMAQYEDAFPNLAKGYGRLFARMGAAGTTGKNTSPVDLLAIPRAGVRFDNVNEDVNVMHTGSITDFDQDAFAAQREGVRATSRNQLQFAMNDLMGLVAEAATTKLALSNGTMEVEEAVDILQDAKSDVYRLLQEEGTLGNLGMKLEDVNSRMNILIETARESYKAIKAEKLDAVKNVLFLSNARKTLTDNFITERMPIELRAVMLKADTLAKVAQAQVHKFTSKAKIGSGFSDAGTDFLAYTNLWSQNRDGAKQRIDTAVKIDFDDSKPDQLFMALGEIRDAVREHPDLAQYADAQLVDIIKFAKTDLLTAHKGQPKKEKQIIKAIDNTFQVMSNGAGETARRHNLNKTNKAELKAVSELFDTFSKGMKIMSGRDR